MKNKHNTIRWALGKNWHRLHPNVQRRFNRLPTEGEPIVYTGTMDAIKRSKAGWLFATLTKVIGNPLSPHQGRDVPMTVELTTQQGKKGVYWKRTYHFKDRKPFSVTSVKKDDKGRMMECVGGGFGMFLDVFAENGELHFLSSRYFWQLGSWYVPLPHWLSPGQTHVIHEDLAHSHGQGVFRFSITMKHAILGTTFFQTGVFSEQTVKK